MSNHSYDYAVCITQSNTLKYIREIDKKSLDDAAKIENDMITHLEEELVLDRNCSFFWT